MLYVDDSGMVERSILACLMHELAHIFVLKLLGNGVKEIYITITGAKMIPLKTMNYVQEFAVASAGPGINLLCAWMFSRSPAGYALAGIHLALAAFNLLPIRELDGARMAKCLLSGFASPTVSFFVLTCLEKTFTAVFGLLGIGMAVRFQNPTLLLMCVWLFMRGEKEKTCVF